jgi:hypothetical protein
VSHGEVKVTARAATRVCGWVTAGLADAVDVGVQLEEAEVWVDVDHAVEEDLERVWRGICTSCGYGYGDTHGGAAHAARIHFVCLMAKQTNDWTASGDQEASKLAPASKTPSV